MKKLIIFIILILCIGFIYLFFKKPQPITNYPSRGETIVAFGDSLISGVGATRGNDLVSELEKLSGEKIINLGISGNTTADGVARTDEVIKQNPKVVMVLLGGNDFLRKVPIDTTFQNLETIVSKLTNAGSVVILLGIQGGLFSDPYEDRFESLAEKYGTLYVPNVLDGLIGRKEFMSDSIHPNDVGYAKLADKIYPALEKALR